MKSDFSSERNLSKIVSKLPIKGVSWRLMNRGDWHDAYVLQDVDKRRYVLKLPHRASTEWEKKLHKERWVLKKLSSSSLKLSPRVVYRDASKRIVPFSYQILDFLEGERISKGSITLRELAICLKKLHKCSFTTWGGLPPRKTSFTFSVYFTYRFHPQIARLPKLVQKQLQPFLAQIRTALRRYGCRQAFSLTHGDVNTRNVLRTKKRGLVFIDWEMVDVRPPASDLADLFVIERFSEKQKTDFLREYGDVSGNMKQEIAVFEKLVLFAELLDDLESGRSVISSMKNEVLTPLLRGR